MKKMKKFLLFVFFASTTIIAQEFKTPLEYLDYVGKEQQAIAKSTWKYTSAVAHSSSARKIDATRKQLVKSIQVATKKIEALKGYKGDVEYRDKVLKYLYFAEKNLNEEYSNIIDMQEVASQSYDLMEAYILTRDLVNKKLDFESEKVNVAQKEFAEKYNIKLVESQSELSKKIKISNQVFDYHTTLYLIFFKVNITDINLTKAIEDKDLIAIDQYAYSLNKFADEGLEKIKNIEKYKNDTSLLEETKKALLYYKKTVNDEIPKIVSFIMKNEKFETTKKRVESSDEKSKDDVESYNNMVKEINTEIGNYNKLNSTNFQEKKEIVDSWNTKADLFISKHVPQD
jgi:hypothetical protein